MKPKLPEKADVKTIGSLMTKMKKQFEAALPKHLTADRLMRITITELRKNPKLQECDPVSLIGSLMLCGQLGLEPGGALGHAYLIPYGKQCQFILGYRGMIDLARRSGQIVSLSAHEVYERDKFEFEYGLNERLAHTPAIGDRGQLIGVYAVAQLKDGGHQMEFMSKAEVDKIRARSKSSGHGPWVTDYDEMAKKTVARRLFKYLPVSIEIQKASSYDEGAERGELDAKGVLIDAGVTDDIFEIDLETGEVIESKSQADNLAQELKK